MAGIDDALLAAIYAAPAADAPRLVYADALLARGDRRGEVIALQCRGADRARADKLLARYRYRWLGPLAAALDPACTVTFERGFVATGTLAASAPAALDTHPAWATLRHVALPKRARPALRAHLERLGAVTTAPRSRKREALVIADLEYVAGGNDANKYFHGARGLHHARAGLDPALVERVMRVVLPWAADGACRDLADEYVPSAWRVLATVKTSQATFLRAWPGHDDGARLRDACTWLSEFRMVDGEPRNRHRLPRLAQTAEAVTAATAAVRAHGIAAGWLLAVLAHVGDATAVTLIGAVVRRALAAGGGDLDHLATWVAPYAQGAAMTALVVKLRAAIAARGQASPLGPLLARWGAPGERLELKLAIEAVAVRVGATRVATMYVVLQSHALPNASATFRWNTVNATRTTWEDGVLVRDECKVGGPAALEDLPRWIAACAKKRKVRWEAAPGWVESSLRGKARAAAIAWLLAG